MRSSSDQGENAGSLPSDPGEPERHKHEHRQSFEQKTNSDKASEPEPRPGLLDVRVRGVVLSRKQFLRALSNTVQLEKCSVLGTRRGARCQMLEVPEWQGQKLGAQEQALLLGGRLGKLGLRPVEHEVTSVAKFTMGG